MDPKIESVFEPRHRIVAMVEHKGRVYIATEQCVFRMTEDSLTDRPVFEQMVFHQIKDAQ